MGVTVANASHADPRNEVNVLVSILIGDDLIAATGECDAGVKRNTLKARRDVLLFFLKNPAGLRSPFAPVAESRGPTPTRKFLGFLHEL
jgi:hypothetical protein